MKNQIRTILTHLDKHFSGCKYELTTATGKLTVVGYFHDLQAIKRDLFNGSDYAIMTKRSDGKFNLTKTFLNIHTLKNKLKK